MKQRLQSSICLGGLLAVVALPVAAQTTEQTGTGLEEVIVTAQRREESAQRVPIAVTALSADALERAGIQSLPQVAQLTPGLQFQAIGASSTPFLRGVGATTTVLGAEAGTALYVDDVYISSQSAALMSLPNIAAIEVAKGPQGTLFGRNATGGVIQIHTRRPSQDTAAELKVGYGNFSTWDASLYATTGITDTVAMDLTLYASEQEEGWGKNLVTGEDAYTHSDYIARSRLLLTPSDRTEINIIGEFEKLENDVGYATRLPAAGELGQNERALLTGAQFTGGFWDTNLDFDSGSEFESRALSVDWRQSLGAVDFRSISAYRKLTVDGRVDFDLSSAPLAHVWIPVEDETFSQEFHLMSPEDSDSRLQWLLGLYYYHQDASYPNFRQYGTLFTLPPSVLAGTATQLIYLDSTQKTDSYAGFAQGTYALTDATNLTLGGRYTSDRRCLDATQYNPSFTTSLLPRHQEGCESFPKFTYKGALDHLITPDMMVYGQVSRGFKSGFFNSQTLQSPGSDPSVPAAVKPETIDAYEVGLKSDWLASRLRVNASAFYYEYEDMQVNAFVNATSRITINAASSTVRGLELEVQAAPIDGLNILVSGAYLDAKYSDFPGAPAFTPRTASPWGMVASQFNAKGNDLPNAPEFTGTLSVTYQLPLLGGDLSMNGTLYHNGGYYFDTENRLKQEQYQLLSASVTWKSRHDFSVSLWGNNLTNEEVLAAANPTIGGDSLTPRPPRTYGVRLGVEF